MNNFRNLVVAASVVVLAGCGGSSTPGDNSNQQDSGNQSSEGAPANATAAENLEKGEVAVAPATSDALDRTYLVGRWSETGDCADATEFRADGTFVFPWGDTGTWQLEGDQLILSSNTDAMRLTRISQDQLDAVSAGGSVHHHRRC